jgi:uncharacterized membrane protein YccC
MTSQQRTRWARVIGVSAGLAVALLAVSLVVRDALFVLLPFAVALGLFAAVMSVMVRRQSRL